MSMGKEIERKFLLKNDGWRGQGRAEQFCQGYLASAAGCVVRVRTAGEKAWLTVKGKNTGAVRSEFEYPIPLDEARAMLAELAEKPLIEKQRHTLELDGATWEIDEFYGDNAGLILAEIELRDENQTFARPDWLGEEVTGDARYYNSNLGKNPYKNWRP
ncbi:CYTH domain-containing protein [Desulfovibrio sp. OttesenSCG-928-C14]|nr:CYTH domain-containing protein [Desulfovibrio sp. OttesenSCG-928-C14]